MGTQAVRGAPTVQSDPLATPFPCTPAPPPQQPPVSAETRPLRSHRMWACSSLSFCQWPPQSAMFGGGRPMGA